MSAHPRTARDAATGPTRRSVVVAAGAAALAVGLSACGASASGAESAASSSADNGAQDADGSEGGASSEDGKGSGDDSNASSVPGTAAAAGAVIVGLADVPVGGATVVMVAGKPVVVAQPTQGQVVARSGVCTHNSCAVAAQKGLELRCPCHGSQFDAATGAVLQGPAEQPLAEVAVSVSGSDVVMA